jgi:hypothetical protein
LLILLEVLDLTAVGVEVHDEHLVDGPVTCVSLTGPADDTRPTWSSIAELRRIAGYPPGIPARLPPPPAPNPIAGL